MKRILLYLCGLILSLVGVVLLKPGSAGFDLALAGAAGFAVPLIDAIAQDFRFLKFEYYSLRYRGERIRVSMSYLYRIKVDGTYLLVRGRRFPQFQPVGGVYKSLPDNSPLLRFSALDDDLVPVDPTSENDLRLRIPAAQLAGFLRWFEDGVDRESGPWREFYEELVSTTILPNDNFGYANARFIRRVYRPLRYSDYAKSRELLVADVFELVPSKEQLEALRQVKLVGHVDIEWVTEDQIRRRGAIPGTNQSLVIGEPAEWVLDA